MFDKQRYLKKQPKYCKYCGYALDVNYFARQANERTGEIERVSILIRCSSYGGGCTYYRWEDSIKNYRTYAHKLPSRLKETWFGSRRGVD